MIFFPLYVQISRIINWYPSNFQRWLESLGFCFLVFFRFEFTVFAFPSFIIPFGIHSCPIFWQIEALWRWLSCLWHSLRRFWSFTYFLEQDVLSSSYTFISPDTNKECDPSSFQWEMVFRYHNPGDIYIHSYKVVIIDRPFGGQS